MNLVHHSLRPHAHACGPVLPVRAQNTPHCRDRAAAVCQPRKFEDCLRPYAEHLSAISNAQLADSSAAVGLHPDPSYAWEMLSPSPCKRTAAGYLEVHLQHRSPVQDVVDSH